MSNNELTACKSCGMAMFGTNELCNKCRGLVPVEKLEELAEQWDFQAEAGNGAREQIFQMCSNELRKIMENYE